MNVYLWELYKEVEYIQSSWTQYIRTWFVFTTNTKLVLDLQYTSVSPTQQRQSWTYFNTSPVMWEQYINGSWYWARSLDNNSNWWYWQSTNVTADTNRHTFELDNTRYIIYTNWTQIYNGTNTRSFTATNTAEMILLAWWSSDGNVVKNYSKAKLYWCKIYDNWTLVRDFVPCYRVSDNEIGLFDKVENKFYTNAGTWAFTKGNDVRTVQPSLLNAYIGEYHREWTPNDHTLLYLPLESDVVDRSWKSWRTFTTSWLSYTTVGGVHSVHVWTNWWAYLTAPKPIVTPSVSKQTISILTYVTSQQTSDRRDILEWRVQNNVWTVLAFEWGTTEIRAFWDSVWDMLSANIIANQRMHIVLTNCSEWKKLYLNWQLVSSWAWVSSPRWSWAYSYEQSQWILCRRGGDYWWWLSLNGNARELIAEDTIWSAEDVSNYYQRIKTKLWF